MQAKPFHPSTDPNMKNKMKSTRQHSTRYLIHRPAGKLAIPGTPRPRIARRPRARRGKASLAAPRPEARAGQAESGTHRVGGGGGAKNARTPAGTRQKRATRRWRGAARRVPPHAPGPAPASAPAAPPRAQTVSPPPPPPPPSPGGGGWVVVSSSRMRASARRRHCRSHRGNQPPPGPGFSPPPPPPQRGAPRWRAAPAYWPAASPPAPDCPAKTPRLPPPAGFSTAALPPPARAARRPARLLLPLLKSPRPAKAQLGGRGGASPRRGRGAAPFRGGARPIRRAQGRGSGQAALHWRGAGRVDGPPAARAPAGGGRWRAERYSLSRSGR